MENALAIHAGAERRLGQPRVREHVIAAVHESHVLLRLTMKIESRIRQRPLRGGNGHLRFPAEDLEAFTNGPLQVFVFHGEIVDVARKLRAGSGKADDFRQFVEQLGEGLLRQWQNRVFPSVKPLGERFLSKTKRRNQSKAGNDGTS